MEIIVVIIEVTWPSTTGAPFVKKTLILFRCHLKKERFFKPAIFQGAAIWTTLTRYSHPIVLRFCIIIITIGQP